MTAVEQATTVAIMQRIRAGWLPHRLSAGSWWWGRPTDAYGFRLWSEGLVPSMSVVERMTTDEIDVWRASLHPLANEAIAEARAPAADTEPGQGT